MAEETKGKIPNKCPECGLRYCDHVRVIKWVDPNSEE
jgi:hypothetical protein